MRPVVSARGGNIENIGDTVMERLNSESLRRSPTPSCVPDTRSLYIGCTDALGVLATSVYRWSRSEGRSQ